MITINLFDKEMHDRDSNNGNIASPPPQEMYKYPERVSREKDSDAHNLHLLEVIPFPSVI